MMAFSFRSFRASKARLFTLCIPLALTVAVAVGSAPACLAQAKKTKPAPKMLGAQAKTTAPGSYVTWKEPKEGAFTVDVPKGWKVEGGILHVGKTEVRRMIEVSAPSDDMAVIVGDFGMAMFVNPTETDQQMGKPEGTATLVNGNFQTILLHFMPPLEFNQWYLQNRLSQLMDDVQIGNSKPLSDVSRKLTAQAKQDFVPPGYVIEITAGVTRFTGTSKETGKPVTGLLLSRIRHMYSPSSDLGNVWWAEPSIVACVNDGSANTRGAKAQAAFERVMQTIKYNGAWALKQAKKSSDATVDAIDARRKNFKPGRIKHTGLDFADSDANHRRFIDLIRGEGVTNPAGG